MKDWYKVNKNESRSNRPWYKSHYFWIAVGIVVLFVGIILAVVFGLNRTDDSQFQTREEEETSSRAPLPETEPLRVINQGTVVPEPPSSSSSIDRLARPQQSDNSTVLSYPSSHSWGFHAAHSAPENQETFALSIDADAEHPLIFAGSPSDARGMGLLNVMFYSPEQSEITHLQAVDFSVMGTSQQKAGFAVSRNWVAAPNFSLNETQRSREGCLYRVTQPGSPEDTETHQYLLPLPKDQGFTMIKFGDIFLEVAKDQLCVTEHKQRHQRVSVYRAHHESSRKLELLQTLEPSKFSKEESLFGHGLQCDAKGLRLVVSDPDHNLVYVYSRSSTKNLFEERQVLELDLRGELQDFQQQISLSGDGGWLVVSSPANSQLLAYQWNGTRFNPMSQELHQNIPDLGTSVALNHSGEFLAVSVSETPDEFFIFSRGTGDKLFQTWQKLSIEESWFEDRAKDVSSDAPHFVWVGRENHLFIACHPKGVAWVSLRN